MLVTWRDIRRGILAIVLVIIPTVLISTYIGPALQNYHITGPGLWQLKQTNVPEEVIETLHEIRLKPFFFKFKLIKEIESRIDNPELFNKYIKKINIQIQSIPNVVEEYIFLAVLALYYFVLWFTAIRWFKHGKF